MKWQKSSQISDIAKCSSNNQTPKIIWYLFIEKVRCLCWSVNSILEKGEAGRNICRISLQSKAYLWKKKNFFFKKGKKSAAKYKQYKKKEKKKKEAQLDKGRNRIIPNNLKTVPVLFCFFFNLQNWLWKESFKLAKFY